MLAASQRHPSTAQNKRIDKGSFWVVKTRWGARCIWRSGGRHIHVAERSPPTFAVLILHRCSTARRASAMTTAIAGRVMPTVFGYCTTRGRRLSRTFAATAYSLWGAVDIPESTHGLFCNSPHLCDAMPSSKCPWKVCCLWAESLFPREAACSLPLAWVLNEPQAVPGRR